MHIYILYSVHVVYIHACVHMYDTQNKKIHVMHF